MEPNENQLSSYFHQNPTNTATSGASPTNGLLPPPEGGGPHAVYPHPPFSSATTTSSSALEGTASAKRKRGRPRKYGTPEQALAARKAQQTSSSHSSSSKDRKEPTASKKSHLAPGTPLFLTNSSAVRFLNVIWGFLCLLCVPYYAVEILFLALSDVS